MPITPTRSGLATDGFVAEVHRAQARARDGAGGDAGFQEVAAGDADRVLKFPWPTAFSSGLRYIGLAFRRTTSRSISCAIKKSSPAQRPTGRGGQREQGEHFDILIERGQAASLTQNGCIITTDSRNTAPATQASRVNKPSSSSSPIPE